MITKEQEEQAREMAKTIYKSESCKGKCKASWCICGYSGEISTSLPVKCHFCGLTIYKDSKMKDYYKKNAKNLCAKCALRKFKKMTALERDILTRAQAIYEAKRSGI